MEMIWTLWFASTALNLAMFVPAYFLKTDKLTDISYALTFVLIAAYGLIQRVTPLGIAAFLMVFTWAMRLGIYLLTRILAMGKDKRFNTIRHNFSKFLAFWLLQGTTVFIVLLPTLLLFEKAEEEDLTTTAIAGFALYLIGILLETVADHQKYVFKRDPHNKGKWIAHGVWKYSRHPNYLGEILVWTGIYLFAVPSLPYPYYFVSAISPIYIFLLLVFVSGVPRLERAADEKWGNVRAYQLYKKKTGVLLPFW